MLLMKEPFDQIADACPLAQLIVSTVREPLLVLDDDLRILFSSGSFQRSFRIGEKDTQNQHFFALDNGVWDTSALRVLLEQTLPQYNVIEGFEVVCEFPRIGRRMLLLNAHRTPYEDRLRTTILLGFEDVTERRDVEREKERLQIQTNELLQQKGILLAELQHRIVNSLQIIASILMLKARAVNSEETRLHLQDAHRRVMSVAAVQQHLHNADRDEPIEVAPYLMKLCDSLAKSMIDDNRPAKLKVLAGKGSMVSADVVSLGLIVTELVINALKYAFPDRKETAAVVVRYDVKDADWQLSVSDNGVGMAHSEGASEKGGLGTGIVNALAHQLDAQVQASSGPEGMTVSVTHATFASPASQAA
jgi:chemotaxis protein methyltransferase CheR